MPTTARRDWRSRCTARTERTRWSAARLETQLGGAPRGVPPRRGAELRQHRGDVVLGRSRRHDEPLGDLRVRQARRRRARAPRAGGRSARPGWRASPRAARAERGARARASARRPASSAARRRARGRSRSPRPASPRRPAATASAPGRSAQPTSPNASAAARQSRRSMAAYGADRRLVELDVDPGDRRPRGDADRAPAGRLPPLRDRLAAACRAARAASARRSSAPTRLRARGPARSAAARPCAPPGPRARPAARAASGSPRRTASSASTVLASSWATVMPRSISPCVIRSASSHSPARRRSHASVTAVYDARLCTSCSSA